MIRPSRTTRTRGRTTRPRPSMRRPRARRPPTRPPIRPARTRPVRWSISIRTRCSPGRTATASAHSQAFGVDPDADAIAFTSPLPQDFASGTALTYHAALGLKVSPLQDGQTYYAILDPVGPEPPAHLADRRPRRLDGPGVQRRGRRGGRPAGLQRCGELRAEQSGGRPGLPHHRGPRSRRVGRR